MAYSSKPYPAVTLRNVRADGTETISQLPGGYREVNRTDTVRRRRPVNRYDYKSSQTGVFTVVQDNRVGVVAQSSGKVHYEGTTNLGRPTKTIDTGRLISACENQLRGKARDAGVNIGNMLAEYRQTAALYEQLSRQGVAFVRSFRRGALKRLGSSRGSRSRANEWLLFQYGISPLMTDIRNAIKELGGKKLPPVIVESSLSTTLDDRYNVPFPYGSVRRSDFSDFRVKCKARVELNDSYWKSTLAQHGLTNPLSIAWEVLPYSFVVDWWINAGSVLESLDNSLIFTSLSGFTSTRLRETATMINGRYQYIDLRRTPKSFPLINSLVINDRQSLRHTLNGLALWRSIR